MTDRRAYDEVYVYTMGRPGFLLQHVVDAQAAQQASAATKPITVVFALVGLHLHLDGGLTGAQVQRIHMRMGQDRRVWPRIELPAERGHDTAEHVLDAAPGADRDDAIERWCRQVWDAYADSHDRIAAIAERYLGTA